MKSVLFFILLSSQLFSQNIKNETAVYKNKVKNEFIKYYEGKAGEDVPLQKILIVPYLYLSEDYDVDASFSPELIDALLLDTIKALILCELKNNTIAIFERIDNGGFAKTVPIKNSAIDRRIQFIKYACEMSNDFAYISPSVFYKTKNETILYLNSPSMVLIDDKGARYNNLKSFLVHEFGSIENFMKVKNKAKVYQPKLDHLSEDSLIALVKEDYHLYAYFFPNDTLGVIDLFLKGLKKDVEIDEYRCSLLQKKIYHRLQHYDRNNNIKKDTTLYIFLVNIYPEVSEFVAEDELIHYKKNHEVTCRLAKDACEVIRLKTFNGNKPIQGSVIKKVLKEKIYD